MPPTTRTRDQRGAAAVEFALLMPVLLVLLFGIISYGYMLAFRQSLSQGASEAARAVVVMGEGVSAADQVKAGRAALTDSLSTFGASCTAAGLVVDSTVVGSCPITVAPCVNDTTRRCVTVTVTHRYRDHSLLPTVPGMGLTLPQQLTFTAVARID